jgi:hypothetical protein
MCSLMDVNDRISHIISPCTDQKFLPQIWNTGQFPTPGDRPLILSNFWELIILGK